METLTVNPSLAASEELQTSKEIFASAVEKALEKLQKFGKRIDKSRAVSDDLMCEVRILQDSYDRYIEQDGQYSVFVLAGYKNAWESAEELVGSMLSFYRAYHNVLEHAKALDEYVKQLKKESSH